MVLHVDINDPAINPDFQRILSNQSDVMQEAYNIPFNLIVEGSYFGDNDCLFQKKCIRESTAEADQDCHLLLLKKASLDVLLDNFIEIKNQMMSIAIEKRKYHRRLIMELLKNNKNKDMTN